jgi:hypothetical protein
MSRGDEIEEGSPKRGWQPPAGGYDDEQGEPRGRGDRDDEVGIAKRNRSGMVTAVGIVGIILGSLGLLAGACTGCLGAFFPMLQEFAKQNANDPNMAKAAQDLARIPAWFIIAEAVVALFRGTGLLVGGIGVLKRRNLGRMLVLAMAAFGVVAYFIDLVGALAMGFLEPSGIPANAVGGLFICGFALFAFIVLLMPKNAAEFRS